jgi:hypothetical protein
VDSRFRGNDGVGEHPSEANDAAARGGDGELWQPRFFGPALRTVKEHNEKEEGRMRPPLRYRLPGIDFGELVPPKGLEIQVILC